MKKARKEHFSSLDKIKKAVQIGGNFVLLATCILFFGGRLKKGEFELETRGLIKNYLIYLNEKHDREMQDKILKVYSDSLKINTSEDMIKVFRHFSSNKDKPE